MAQSHVKGLVGGTGKLVNTGLSYGRGERNRQRIKQLKVQAAADAEHNRQRIERLKVQVAAERNRKVASLGRIDFSRGFATIDTPSGDALEGLMILCYRYGWVLNHHKGRTHIANVT